MSAAAANYFGKQLDYLRMTEVTVGTHAHVEIGEAQTVGVDK